MIPEFRQIDHRQHPVETAFDLVPSDTLNLQGQTDILFDGTPGQQRIHLRHIADGPVYTGDFGSVMGDGPGCRLENTGDHVQQCRFAAATGADKGDEFTLFDSHRGWLECVHFLTACDETLGDLINDYRHLDFPFD